MCHEGAAGPRPTWKRTIERGCGVFLCWKHNHLVREQNAWYNRYRHILWKNRRWNGTKPSTHFITYIYEHTFVLFSFPPAASILFQRRGGNLESQQNTYLKHGRRQSEDALFIHNLKHMALLFLHIWKHPSLSLLHMKKTNNSSDMNPRPFVHLSFKGQDEWKQKTLWSKGFAMTSSEVSSELCRPFLSGRGGHEESSRIEKSVGLTCHGTGNSHPLILCVSRKINFILPLFSDYNALKLPQQQQDVFRTNVLQMKL